MTITLPDEVTRRLESNMRAAMAQGQVIYTKGFEPRIIPIRVKWALRYIASEYQLKQAVLQGGGHVDPG